MKLPTILEVDISDRPGSISGDLYAVAAGAALGAYADPTPLARRTHARARPCYVQRAGAGSHAKLRTDGFGRVWTDRAQ